MTTSNQRGSSAERRRSALYAIASVLLLLTMGLHWAQPPTVVAQIDLPPPFGIGEMLRKCAFSWADVHTYFGSIDNCSSWYPYSLALLGFDAVAGPSYGQALVFIAPVIFSWLGAFAFARAIGASPLAAAFGAWVYAFNPARQSSFGEYATGEVYAALLPWVGYWIVEAARAPARRRTVLFALAAIAFVPLSILAATPQLLVATAVGGIAAFVIASATAADDKASYRRWFVGAAGAGIVASLWWTVPNVASYAGVSFTHPVDAGSVAWTFDRASLLNELRFCASWVWQYAEYNPWSIEFEANPSLYASGFVAAVWLIVALVACHGPRLAAVRAFGGLALAMLFVAKGVHPPLGSIAQALWAIPGFIAFIEPFGPAMIAALALAACAALGADALAGASAAAARRAALVAVGASVVALWWNDLAPVTGALFHEKMNETPGEHIVLAQEWTDTARYLDGSAEAGGVVVLPPNDHYQADYDWGYRGADILAVELVDRPVLMPGAPWWYAQTRQTASLDALVDSLVERRSALTRRVLLDLGVRFAIVRGDVHPIAGGLAPDVGEYRSLFGAPAARFGAINVYDLGAPVPRLAQIAGARPDDGDAAAAELARATGLRAGAPQALALARASHPAVDDRLVVGRQFAALGPAQYAPIPTLVGRSADGPTTVDYDVVDPAAAGVTGTIEIGVWPREATTYSLAIDGRDERMVRVPQTPTAVWATFRHVGLHPGHNSLVFRWPPTAVNAYAAFLPPRFAADQPWQPHVNELLLVGFGGRAFVHDARGIRLEAPLTADPTIVLQTVSPGGDVGMDVDLDDAGRRLACFETLGLAQTVHLAASVRDCIEGTGARFTTGDALRVRVDAVAPRALRSDVTPDVDIVVGTTAVSPMTAVPRDAPAPEALGDANGLAAVVRTAAPASPLVLAQSYSPVWVAYDATHRRLLAHWRAFGWSNAWTVEPGATVVLVNLLSAATLLLLVLDAVFVGLLWRRR